MLTLATLVMVAGIYVFKFPNDFSFGGVTGIAIILSGLFDISASSITFIINMALLLVGFLFLGRGFGIKTVYVSVLMSGALSLLEYFFPMSAPLTNEPVLELIFAIVLPSFGSAILFNMNASGGGTDIIAMVLRKYTSFNIGSALFLVDLCITVAACFVFDAQTGLSLFLWPDGDNRWSSTASLRISISASILRLSAMSRSPSANISIKNCIAGRRFIRQRVPTAICLRR